MGFNDVILYFISTLGVLILGIIYAYKTIGRDKRYYYYYLDEGEEAFDWDFLKRIITQLFVVFFSLFTFLNIVYFVFYGKWISDENMQISKGFIIIGSVLYLFDMLKSSMNIIREQRKKRK